MLLSLKLIIENNPLEGVDVWSPILVQATFLIHPKVEKSGCMQKVLYWPLLLSRVPL